MQLQISYLYNVFVAIKAIYLIDIRVDDDDNGNDDGE